MRLVVIIINGRRFIMMVMMCYDCLQSRRPLQNAASAAFKFIAYELVGQGERRGYPLKY